LAGKKDRSVGAPIVEKKIPRNAACPCGSGRKYKHCCGHPSNRITRQKPQGFPLEIPANKNIIYLDTCVWSLLGQSETAKSGLVKFCNEYETVLAISSFTLFELSRAPQILANVDELLFELRHHIYLASIYDDVIESELNCYPAIWRMKWLPLGSIQDFIGPEFVSTLVSEPSFVEAREDFRRFALGNYKSLVDLKKNFPPIHGDDYSIEDAPYFAYATSTEYLSRHFPHFLKNAMGTMRKEGPTSFDSILSLRIRALFLFMKYYLHEQLPNDSDFFDFAHLSYAPYCDGFVTEKNVSNVLRRIKSNELMLQNTDIVFVSDFVSMMEQRLFLK
jgi:hypothetical protein